VATAPIKPLAWEPPHAAGAALDKDKKKEKKNLPQRKLNQEISSWLSGNKYDYHP